MRNEIWKVECFWNSVTRRIYVWRIHGLRKRKKNVTYSSSGNETEIDFVLVEKENSKFLKDVTVIFWEVQHRLVVLDVKKENLFKRIKVKRNMQWRVWKLKEKRQGKNLRTM